MSLDYPPGVRRPPFRLAYRVPFRPPAGIGAVIAKALADINADDLVGIASVTEIPNSGTGGTGFNYDTVLGTSANGKPHPSGSLRGFGAAGDNITTPDSVANSITGTDDLDLRWHGTFDDVTEQQEIITKRFTAQDAWIFYLQTDGKPGFSWWKNGGTRVIHNSSEVIAASNGVPFRLRITLDVDNGAGGTDVKFWVPGTDITLTDGTQWEQLGSTFTSAGTTSIDNTTAPIQIGGSLAAGGNPIKGTTIDAQIYNGIDVTLVLDMNPLDQVNDSDLTFNSGLMALDLPGSSGNFGSSPNAYTSGVTGSFELLAKINLVDYTPTTRNTIISKHLGTGNQRSFEFLVDTTGTLRLVTSANGVAAVASNSTVATGAPDKTDLWVRVTWSNPLNVANFYTSTDTISDPSLVNWTLLGAADVAHVSAGIFKSTALLNIGAHQNGTLEVATGTVFRAQIIQGIGGTVVSDFPPQNYITSNTVIGLKRLDLPGDSGDVCTTPNAAANRITGDIDIRVHVNLEDYSPPLTVTLLSKFAIVGNQRAYDFILDAFGDLHLRTSSDGAVGTITDQVATESLSITNRTSIWLRAALDVDNGSGDSDLTFYTSLDGINWTQLGLVVNSGGILSIFASSAEVELGASAGGTIALMTGTMFNAQIYNGILDDGGTLAVDYNSEDFIIGASQVSILTGETWAQQGNAELSEVWTAQGNAAFTGQWTLNNNTFIQNTTHKALISIGSYGLETTAGQDISIFTRFIVGRFTTAAPAANQVLFDARSDAAKSVSLFSDNANSDKWTLDAGGTPIALSEPYDNDLHVFTVVSNGANSLLRVSGVGEITGNPGSEVLDYGTILAALGSGSSAPFSYNRDLTFNSVLSAALQTRVEDLLAQEYQGVVV